MFAALAWATALIVVVLPALIRRFSVPEPSSTLRRRLQSGARMLANGIGDTGSLVKSGRWQAMVGAVGFFGLDVAALVVAFGAFGPIPPLAPLVFAYTIGQLGGLIPLPGGIGGTDGGLIGATVLYGSSLTQATAAVLAYRVFQLGVPAILGTIAFVQLRLSLSRSPAPAAQCAPLAEEYPGAVRDGVAA